MPKLNPEKKDALIRDLVASIEAEDRAFQMEFWTTFDRDHYGMRDERYRELLSREEPASCDTASCIAGHLEAIRPELAEQLAPRFRGSMGLMHSQLAAAVYEHETGEACPFDFWGHQSPKLLADITRKDAIAHVLGEHPEWPQVER